MKFNFKDMKINAFKKIGENITRIFKTEEYTLIDTLLKNDAIETILNKIDLGIVLAAKQESLLKDKLLKSNNVSFDFLEKLLHTHIPISNEYIATILLNKYDLLNKEFKVIDGKYNSLIYKPMREKYETLTQWLNEKKLNNQLNELFINAWKNNIEKLVNLSDNEEIKDENGHNISKNDYLIRYIMEPISKLPENLIMDKTSEEYNHYISLINLIDLTDGNSMNIKIYIANIHSLIRKIEDIRKESSHYIPEIIKDKEINNDISIEYLLSEFNNNIPKITRIKIDYIIKLFQEIILNKESIPDFDIGVIKKIYEIDLPNIMVNYLDINQKYKTNIKNIDDKNANELLVDIIDDIKIMCEITLDKMNNIKLADLSVTNRYLQDINKITVK